MLRNLRIILLCFLMFMQGQILASTKQVLYIYNWAGYISETTIKEFEDLHNAKVIIDVFDNNFVSEAKLLAGRPAYDIYVPSAIPYLHKQINMGLYEKLNKNLIPNYKYIDPELLKLLSPLDYDNDHAVPWMWGTVGIGYNHNKIMKIMPDAPVDDLKIILDPKYAKKFSECGIAIIDSSYEVIPLILTYLGLDPNSNKLEDLKKATDVLLAIKPYIKQVDSSKYLSDLVSEDICICVGWSGDIMNAKLFADEIGYGTDIRYKIPKQGGQVWIDALVILKNSKNKDLAHKFINFLLDPRQAAINSNKLRYANSNLESRKYMDKILLEDKDLIPDHSNLDKIYTLKIADKEFEKIRTREWMHILHFGGK